MLKDWTFFSNFVSNVRMTLAKTDMQVAQNYVESMVAKELQPMFEIVKTEYELTVSEILTLVGEYALLAGNESLERTLAIRDTYLTPLHTLQVHFLKQVREIRAENQEPDPELLRALSVTINGIATGLRNTG
jgi:phosphoenolpyruvate carboxylase